MLDEHKAVAFCGWAGHGKLSALELMFQLYYY
jgi:hypothetical protein